MNQPISIAVAQTCPLAGNLNANIDEHLSLVRVAAANGADAVLFPELSLSGYELPMAPQLAVTEDDPRLAPLRDAAVAHRLTLIAGAPLRLGQSLHIAALIARPDGSIDWYTKQRLGKFPASSLCDSTDGTLPPPEPSVFSPGTRNPLIRVGDHLAAVAVCADIGRPDHAQQAADRGASIYLASMFVIPSEFEGEATRLAQYARQHRMLTCMSNFGGPTGSLRSAGKSSIWSPDGQLLAQLDPSGPGIAFASHDQTGWRRGPQDMK